MEDQTTIKNVENRNYPTRRLVKRRLFEGKEIFELLLFNVLVIFLAIVIGAVEFIRS